MEIPVIPIPSSSFFRSRLASKSALALSLIALFAPLQAQEPPAPTPPTQPISLADAAQLGQNIFDQSAVTGMVLVVVRNQEVLIKGYGQTAPASGRTPDARSLVRLCSVSKVLTTDLLAQLVATHKLALKDPLQSFAPPSVQVPTGPANRPITLLDLATHTSGLPREISAYPRKTPHFTFPTYDQRWTWLPHQQLKTAPGAAALYSNVGFDFLGDALASASGGSYAHLLHDSLLQPLRMWDTTLYPNADQCARLLQPDTDQGPCTSTEASGASGGIYSTPADMAKFLQYLLHLPGSPAPPAGALDMYLNPIQLRSTQGLSHAGEPTGIGLAWIGIGDPGTPSTLLEKTGGGAGFTAYIALNPARQTGIFLAATWARGEAKVEIFHESNNLLAALANVPPLPPKFHPAARRRATSRRHPAASPSSPTRSLHRHRHPSRQPSH